MDLEEVGACSEADSFWPSINGLAYTHCVHILDR